MQWTLFAFLSVVCFSQLASSDKGCIMINNIQYTRCLKPSPHVIKTGLPPNITKKILEYHNEKRRAASATKMMKIYWDESLAKIAQKWSEQCPQHHDYLDARDVPGWVNPIGQSIGYGLPNPMELMKMWYDEKKLWDKGERKIELIGHYTQMMTAYSTRIGCGYSICIDSGYYFVCNYAIGQSMEAKDKPFQVGPRCQDCPSTCVNGLCDCHGKMCYHYGTMDPNTCICKCYPNFNGTQCEHKICASKDGLICARIPKNSQTYYCNRYANVPVECPFMCGVCP